MGWGLLDIVIGILLLSKYTKLGAYLLAVWLVLITFNLFTTGNHFDIALHAVMLAAGAIVLGLLSRVCYK